MNSWRTGVSCGVFAARTVDYANCSVSRNSPGSSNAEGLIKRERKLWKDTLLQWNVFDLKELLCYKIVKVSSYVPMCCTYVHHLYRRFICWWKNYLGIYDRLYVYSPDSDKNFYKLCGIFKSPTFCYSFSYRVLRKWTWKMYTFCKNNFYNGFRRCRNGKALLHIPCSW